jgi:hypothetical protein
MFWADAGWLAPPSHRKRGKTRCALYNGWRVEGNVQPGEGIEA